MPPLRILIVGGGIANLGLGRARLEQGVVPEESRFWRFER